MRVFAEPHIECRVAAGSICLEGLSSGFGCVWSARSLNSKSLLQNGWEQYSGGKSYMGVSLPELCPSVVLYK